MPSPNVALSRPYSLSPAPNYRLTRDANDGVQLTDGLYTEGYFLYPPGYFWKQNGTVGWTQVSPVSITLDLGQDTPISGASFHTAAGVAEVQFPASISVLVSVDGKAWYEVGDLVAESNTLHGSPPLQVYHVHRFWTDRWRVHGRWVKFVVDLRGKYLFADEIEVYRGADEWLQLPLPNYPAADGDESTLRRAIRRRIHADVERLAAMIKAGPVALTVKEQLLRRLHEALARPVEAIPIGDPKDFRAKLPLTGGQRKIFVLQAHYWEALGVPPFSVWVPRSPYDPLPYLSSEAVPASAGHEAAVTLMRGERRPVAVNLVNARGVPVTVRARVMGLPSGDDAAMVSARYAVWTDTREGDPVALALLEAEQAGDAYQLRVSPGTVGQLWLTVRAPESVPAGHYRGQLALQTDEGDRVDMPLLITVAPVSLPRSNSLHLGGWDYTDREDMYGVTDKNRDALVAMLREYLIDTPWATRSVLPAVRYDDFGKVLQPDTGPFDRWITRWRGAARYHVFVSAGDEFDGARVGTREFTRKVAEWVRFWWAHARARGLGTRQLALLLVDEPHTAEDDRRLVEWASAIKSAAPGITIWENPTWINPRSMDPRVGRLSDVLCPPAALWRRGGVTFARPYLEMQSWGKRLGFYGASGPSSAMDPYAYYRLMAWQAFAVGATEEHFWAFADNGGVSSWNPYLAPHVSYAPLFIGLDSVNAAKPLEAIRDGVEDYETLAMLRRAVELRKALRPADGLVAEAEELLSPRVTDVLAVSESDRAAADRVREEALRLLERLR